MGLRADITAAASEKKKLKKQWEVTETYNLFEISSSVLKISNQGLMESVSDVIKKHGRGSSWLFVQHGKGDAAASSNNPHHLDSIFCILILWW